jgi:hemerythrin
MVASTPGFNEELATGISEIDAHHRTLVTNMASLDQVFLGGDLHRALDMLKFLEGYVADHFGAEERCMVSTGYPDVDEHRALHVAFAGEFARRKREFETNRSLAFLFLGLSDWLNAWMQEHVRGADTHMAEYIRLALRG